MKYILTALLCCAMALGGCRKKTSTKAGSAATRQVTVYMYSEYIDPDILKSFEAATKLKAKVVTYENTEEMIAALQQGGGASQYDVVVVSDVAVPRLVKTNLIRAITYTKVPNGVNVGKLFRKTGYDPEGKYTLPYQWGTVGLMYDKRKVTAPGISWSVIFDPAKQPGPFILMDSMRDMLGIALKYQGHSVNSREPAEIKSAGDLLLAAKKSGSFRAFEGGVGGKNRVVAGEAVAAVVYNGDAIKVIAESKDKDYLAYAVPEDGGVIWTDVMVITAKGPNPQGAYKFINHILDAKVGAQLSNFNRYATPNAAAMKMIRKEDLENPGIYPPEAVRAKLDYLQDLGKDLKIYDEVWTMVKAK